MADGLLGHVGISFQDSFGTSNVNSMFYFPIISESVTEAIPPLVSEGMRGRFEAGPTFEGFHEIAGDIIFEAHPILVGMALKAWTSASSDVTLNDSAYTHTIKPNTADFDALAAVRPMTVEIFRDIGSAFLYSDMLCNELTLEVVHGTVVKATMALMGGKFTKAVKSAPSYLPGSEYTWHQSSIQFTNSAGTIGAIDEISQATITLNNNLEAIGTLEGTKTPNRIKRSGFRTAEFAGTVLFTRQEDVDDDKNQREQRAVMTSTGQELG